MSHDPFLKIVAIVREHQRDNENTTDAVYRHVWRSRIFFVLSAVLGIVALLELLRILGG